MKSLATYGLLVELRIVSFYV